MAATARRSSPRSGSMRAGRSRRSSSRASDSASPDLPTLVSRTGTSSGRGGGGAEPRVDRAGPAVTRRVLSARTLRAPIIRVRIRPEVSGRPAGGDVPRRVVDAGHPEIRSPGERPPPRHGAATIDDQSRRRAPDRAEVLFDHMHEPSPRRVACFAKVAAAFYRVLPRPARPRLTDLFPDSTISSGRADHGRRKFAGGRRSRPETGRPGRVDLDLVEVDFTGFGTAGREQEQEHGHLATGRQIGPAFPSPRRRPLPLARRAGLGRGGIGSRPDAALAQPLGCLFSERMRSIAS